MKWSRDEARISSKAIVKLFRRGLQTAPVLPRYMQDIGDV